MILATADWHLRRTTPKSRIDDFFRSQEIKVRHILNIARENNCPLIIAGDFFEKARPGDYIEQWIIHLLQEYRIRTICVPGQHDLPSHQLKFINDSGLGVLEAAGVITLLTDPTRPIIHNDYIFYGCPFGTDPNEIVIRKSATGKVKVLIWHHMVINEPLWEEQVADKAGKVLRLYPQFDLIITGDNHQSFIYDRKGKWLINPGSLMRKAADQIDHKPSIYLYDNGEVERIYLPIEQDVFDISHIKDLKAREVRYGAFIDKLHKGYTSGIDLNSNFTSFFSKNKIRKPVENLVWECIPDDK